MVWFEGYLGFIFFIIVWKGLFIDMKRLFLVEIENVCIRVSLEKFKDICIVKGYFEICNVVFWL